MNKEKSDFTKEKLRPFILEMARMNGYAKPSTYFDEKLQQVKLFNDRDFECMFFLDIHYLCNEYADKFWSESNREDITKWLKSNAGGSGLITPIFDRTWENVGLPDIAGNQPPDIITENLSHLSGYWYGIKIMQVAEYNRLIEYARFTMDNNCLPKNIVPIKNGGSNLSKDFYRKTIHLLSKQLKTEKKQPQKLWRDFLQDVFKDQWGFIDYDLSKKFGCKFKTYDTDKEKIIYKTT